MSSSFTAGVTSVSLGGSRLLIRRDETELLAQDTHPRRRYANLMPLIHEVNELLQGGVRMVFYMLEDGRFDALAERYSWIRFKREFPLQPQAAFRTDSALDPTRSGSAGSGHNGLAFVWRGLSIPNRLREA